MSYSDLFAQRAILSLSEWTFVHFSPSELMISLTEYIRI